MRAKNAMLDRCVQIVSAAPIPQPFSLEALRHNVAAQRGRPLTFHSLPQPTAPEFPSGMWLGTGTADHVFYDGQTTDLHIRHIIFHELGHIFFDHNAAGLADNDLLYGAADMLDPTLIRRLLGRIRYSTVEEQEAELVATLMDEAVESLSRGSRSGKLPRLALSLGYQGER
ncbi:hypothetical protein [Actinoplanes sp. NBRC 103695]|uniref:hypothetical protein n=1 Tax=Actinoplanes sp. NBRC 103695 TaxID=3032202 RepID=UPI0024A24474|nr:hypothetical protein [Actinoplanes sp. NBRC 103695]GLZ00848.1 hypothetical protein Acsp02_81000 [Actinoplanes sp. NBRC 103695]